MDNGVDYEADMKRLLKRIDDALSNGDPAVVGNGWETYDSLVAIEEARKIIADELAKL